MTAKIHHAESARSSYTATFRFCFQKCNFPVTYFLDVPPKTKTIGYQPSGTKIVLALTRPTTLQGVFEEPRSYAVVANLVLPPEEEEPTAKRQKTEAQAWGPFAPIM